MADMPSLPGSADVIVVGAGPAGLSAAVALRAQGVAHVLVLDREAEAGGIPRHCGHYPYGLREFRRLMKGPAYAARLVAAAQAAGVTIATGVSVTALHPGPAVSVTSDAGVQTITARAVLLATGGRETPRAARLIGGTKPGGVMTTGALQGLVYLNHRAPFRRPVILGTELVAFSAIMTCAHLGIRPLGMIESGSRTTARWPTGLYPRMRGMGLWLNTTLVVIEGQAQVTGVVLRGPEGERHVATDGVIVSGQFRPEANLLAQSHLATDPATGGPEVDQHGRLSDPTFFAAGNLLRPVETAGWCWAEGRAVASSIAAAIAGVLSPPTDRRITLRGDALRYVVPQRAGGGGPLDLLQLRVARAARGRLSLRVNGAEVASRALSALPERRITLPLPPGTTGAVEIVLEEP
jgi:thioredoxin reductase